MSLSVRVVCTGLLALLNILCSNTSQASSDRFLPRCGGIFGLCGYYDRETKAEVIPRRFERATWFSEDLAAVRIKGLYGFINRSGKIVIKPRFDLAGGFFKGLAEVLVGGQTGVINRKGKMVVTPRFARSMALTEDVLLVRSG